MHSTRRQKFQYPPPDGVWYFYWSDCSKGKDREIDAVAHYNDIVFLYSSRRWDASEHQLVLRDLRLLGINYPSRDPGLGGVSNEPRETCKSGLRHWARDFYLGALQRRRRDAKSRGCRENLFENLAFPFWFSKFLNHKLRLNMILLRYI